MDLLKELRKTKHHLYKLTAKPLWKIRHGKCKHIPKSKWPKDITFPWSRPKYFEKDWRRK